jgi:hypothetical protein
MLILKFLHILSMFSAVTLALGGAVFLHLVAHAGDAAAYRRLDGLIQRTDLVAITLFVAGIVFGILTALAGGFDLVAGWLILAYILVAAIVIDGILFLDPWYRRLRKAANIEDPVTSAAEFHRLVHSHRGRHLASLAVGTSLWVAIIFVMVVKPNPF